MTRWLLDTNVVSELRRPKANERVISFVESQSLDTLLLTSITLAEIRFGIEPIDVPEKRHGYLDWLERKVRPMFDGSVLQVTEDTMLRWRLLVHAGRKQGMTHPEPNLLIASIALENEMTIVTRNTRDFVRAGATVLDPWAP